jgi:hypothetical protein
MSPPCRHRLQPRASKTNLGTAGRWFESSCPDQQIIDIIVLWFGTQRSLGQKLRRVATGSPRWEKSHSSRQVVAGRLSAAGERLLMRPVHFFFGIAALYVTYFDEVKADPTQGQHSYWVGGICVAMDHIAGLEHIAR